MLVKCTKVKCTKVKVVLLRLSPVRVIDVSSGNQHVGVLGSCAESNVNLFVHE